MIGSVHAAVEEDLAIGLALAGIKDIYLYSGGSDANGLREWFRSTVSEGKGLVVLSVGAASSLKRELYEKRALGMILPVVVTLPAEGEDIIASELIRRAVGMMPGEGGQ